MHIHILKTDIASQEGLLQVGSILNNHPQVEEWSVDLDDCDRVLRAVTHELPEAELIVLLCKNGISCEILAS